MTDHHDHEPVRIPPVDIEMHADAVAGRLIVNGLELSMLVASDWKIEANGQGDPRLTVHFDGPVHTYLAGEAVVDEETAEALMALGWTPPAGHPITDDLPATEPTKEPTP